MMSTPTSDPLALERLSTFAEAALDAAKAAGADAADAIAVATRSRSVTVRNGTVEEVDSAEGTDIGLRVFLGASSAVATLGGNGDLTAAAERAVAIARAAPADEAVRLASAAELARHTGADALELTDRSVPEAEALTGRADALEAAMRSVAGVTNSGGASASASEAARVLATSHGFLAGYRGTRHSHGATAVAGDGTRMERDSWYSTKRHLADLADVAEVGRTAGQRAVRRLGGEPLTTRRATVVFEPRAASGFVSHLLGAINGTAVARNASILAGRLGTRVYPAGTTVRDDPTRRRALASRPFDGEGLDSTPLDYVRDGVLEAYVLDIATAGRLGMASNGRAARGNGPPTPAPTNVSVEGGAGDLESLMASAGSGFLVTDLIGVGANIVSGSYSRGAAGFWFENGEIVHPVNEVTVAGELADMFARAIFADDAPGLYATDAPSVAIEGLTIGGR